MLFGYKLNIQLHSYYFRSITINVTPFMKIHNIITITLKDVMFTINYLISSTRV